MEARIYLNALRRSWWLIVLGPVLAAATAFFYSESLTPVYRTSSTLLVNQTQVPGSIQYNDILTSERLTNTYAALLEDQRGYLRTVIEEMNLPLTEDELARKINVGVVRNTQLLRLSVEDTSPQLAASIANALAEAFISDNATQLADAEGIAVAVPARVPTSPASPNVMQNTILAAILGVLIVSGVAFLREYLDDTVKADEDTEEVLGLPTIGSIRRLKSGPKRASPLVTASGVDAFTQLRTNIHFAGLSRPLKRLVVTGSLPGEGKSTTAAGLAIAMSQAGQRVILVDTDLRRPSLHLLFNVSNSYGITGLLLKGSEDPTNALMATSYKNLVLLPSGPPPANPADLLMSRNWQRLVERLCEIAHYVIFDTPPVLSASDASILAGQAEGTILVIEAGKTRRDAIRHSLTTLERTKSNVVGIVKNKIKPRRSSSYYYQYSTTDHDRRRRADLKPSDVAQPGLAQRTGRHGDRSLPEEESAA